MARRRPSVAWFPTLGDPLPEAVNPDDSAALAGKQFDVVLENTTQIARKIIPLTWDQPLDERAFVGQTQASLADAQGSAYRLRRIVGTICAAKTTEPPANAEVDLPVLFGAALAVVPWDDHSNTPEADVNPIDANDIREPWIWRRCWVFGSAAPYGHDTDNFLASFQQFPTTTSYTPQNRGEFIDQKTARVIEGDERLCLCVAASFLTQDQTPPPEGNLDTVVRGFFDYRILATLRKASGRGGTVR